MTFAVLLAPRATKFLEKLDRGARKRIEERLQRLAAEPVPSDAKFLGRDEQRERMFRYRIGDYRALYKVKERDQAILVVKVEKREHAYE